MVKFFSYGTKSISYWHDTYPSETFTCVLKCGLALLVTTDPELMKQQIMGGTAIRLVIQMFSSETSGSNLKY